MCGIVGGLGVLDKEELKDMAEAISHRGPDNTSYFSFEDVHLAHTRLSIIDLSNASNQPLWDDTDRACIVFNGEIYNYLDLKKDLISNNVNFNSEGDAEVLLNLYLYYGIDFLEKVNGIFAFAIWDKKENELIVARDHFGIKPLYYTENDDGFYFASEIKALLKLKNINKEFNFDALYRTLVFLWSPGRSTLFKCINKLEPGHILKVRNGNVVENKEYWTLPNYKPDNRDEKSLANLVLKKIETSVNEQLVSDVPVGAFLSGGLDSSLVVALATQKSKQPIQCFTIDAIGDSNNDGFEDDLPYAKAVAKYLDVPLEIVKVRPNIIDELKDMIYHLDELQADPAPINVKLICKRAKEMGYKVLLSGAGGDDFFSGYRRHYAINVEKYWGWLPAIARRLIKSLTRILPKGNPRFRRVAKAFQYADLNQDERLLSYFYWIDPNIAKELFVSEVQNKISTNPMKFILDDIKKLPYSNKLEKMLFLEKKYFLVDHNFNYTDKMSMACGVEVRVPLVDKNISYFASSIPSKYKQKGRIGKYILKKAAESVLPKGIIYRPKSGFGAPLRNWLKGDLAPLVEELLSSEKIKERNIFKAENVRDLISKDREGKEDYSYTIFALLCFELWCQEFID